MANYVAHHSKKRERLARMEEDLVRSIRSGDLRERQLFLADEVRLAKVRALKAERAQFEPATRGYSDRMAAIDEQIASLEVTASENILAEYSLRSNHASAS